MDIFKNRTVQIALGVVVLILVGLGVFFLFANNTSEEVEDGSSAVETRVETVTADEIGLTLEMKPDGKQIKFKIAEATGVDIIEYEMTYEADASAEEQSQGGEDRVQRGITGESQVDIGETSYESEWLDLGSCSRNICKYDTGVESIDITLKLTKSNGDILQVEDTIEL